MIYKLPLYSTKLYRKCISLVCCRWHCYLSRNNTDGNKLMIFSGIASYYGDNYTVSITRDSYY